MKRHDQVADAFGSMAPAYLTSQVHASGADLQNLAAWVTRMRTSAERVVAIRSMWMGAPDEVRQYFGMQNDCSFALDALMVEGVRVG